MVRVTEMRRASSRDEWETVDSHTVRFGGDPLACVASVRWVIDGTPAGSPDIIVPVAGAAVARWERPDGSAFAIVAETV